MTRPKRPYQRYMCESEHQETVYSSFLKSPELQTLRKRRNKTWMSLRNELPPDLVVRFVGYADQGTDVEAAVASTYFDLGYSYGAAVADRGEVRSSKENAFVQHLREHIVMSDLPKPTLLRIFLQVAQALASEQSP